MQTGCGFLKHTETHPLVQSACWIHSKYPQPDWHPALPCPGEYALEQDRAKAFALMLSLQEHLINVDVFWLIIHSFEVVGPEFSVVITGGTPNTDVPIQAWLFLN